MENRVLVVDDEKIIVKGLKFSLEQEGWRVDCAYDGEEALELAGKNNYSIILLDLMLPKLSGTEVCQQIREKRVMIWIRSWVWSTVPMIISPSLSISWK